MNFIIRFLFNINNYLSNIMIYVSVRALRKIYNHCTSYFKNVVGADEIDISALAGDPGAGAHPIRAGVGADIPYHQIVNKSLRIKNKFWMNDFSYHLNFSSFLFHNHVLVRQFI